jgi:small subunit ribosomal protein S5
MPDNNNQQRKPRNNRSEPEAKEFDERVVHIDRVASVAEGGRRFHFRALVAIGDHKGRVGIGVAKGVDVTSAVNKAVGIAKKALIKVSLYKDTIPHDSQASSGGSNILIMPARPGTGLIAGGVSRTILEVAGVRNALSKSLGSNNKINSARATILALETLVPAKDWITRIDRSNKSSETPKSLKKEVFKPTIIKTPKTVIKTPVKVKSAVKKPVSRKKEAKK